jgi:hypothetical protein
MIPIVKTLTNGSKRPGMSAVSCSARRVSSFRLCTSRSQSVVAVVADDFPQHIKNGGEIAFWAHDGITCTRLESTAE